MENLIGKILTNCWKFVKFINIFPHQNLCCKVYKVLVAKGQHYYGCTNAQKLDCIGRVYSRVVFLETRSLKEMFNSKYCALRCVGGSKGQSVLYFS